MECEKDWVLSNQTNTNNGRRIKKPAWCKGYVLSQVGVKRKREDKEKYVLNHIKKEEGEDGENKGR